MNKHLLLKYFLLCIFLTNSAIYAETPSNNKNIPDNNKQESIVKDYIYKAQLHLKAGEYRKAHKLVIKSIEIDKQIYGFSHHQTASDLTLLAKILYEQNQYIRAKTFFLKSQKIRKQLFSKKNIVLTENLFGLALIEKSQAKFEESLIKHKQVLKLREISTGNNYALIAQSLLEIANLEAILAFYENANLNLSRAEDLINKKSSNDHSLYIQLLRQKSQLATAKGSFGLANKYDKVILDKQIKTYGRHNVLVADSLTNMAVHMNMNNRAALAIPLLNETSSIYHEEFGSHSLKIATMLSYIARANFKIGAYIKGNEINNQSSSIIKMILIDAKHPLIANNLINRATYLAATQRYDAANQHFLEAQIILEEVYRSNHPEVAQIIADRADLFVKQKQFSKAKTHFIDAITILKSHFQADHPLLISVSNRYKNFTDLESKLAGSPI